MATIATTDVNALKRLLRSNIKAGDDGRYDTMSDAEIEKYAAKVQGDMLGNECALWTGASVSKTIKGSQHGVMRRGSRKALAHRLAYANFVGDIPGDHGVLHRCDTNGKCQTLKHLYAGTHKQNMQDKKRHGTQRGLKFGEQHAKAKLTEDDVRAIRSLRGTMFQKDIAKRYGVTQSAIMGIMTGRNWKHVK